MIKRDGKRDLTPSQQLLCLRSNPAISGGGEVRVNKLTWRTLVQPTPLARSYQANIVYAPRKAPIVTISKPDLEFLAQGRPLPHVYRNPLCLCLYLPRTEEWSPKKRIDKTIIPWTYLWLFYFEDWLATDDWKGGGMHPGKDTLSRVQRRVSRKS